jgi:hypothetical protein
MAVPFVPAPEGVGLFVTNTTTIEDPPGSKFYAYLDGVSDPAGSGLYAFTSIPRPEGVYRDWGLDGSSGRVTVTNEGTTETFPVIEVTGGLSGGFVIADITSGRVVVLRREVPLGSTVTINQRSGSATIDGQSDISGFLTSFGFFSIPAGETHVIQFSGLGAVTGTPQIALTVQDAYL